MLDTLSFIVGLTLLSLVIFAVVFGGWAIRFRQRCLEQLFDLKMAFVLERIEEAFNGDERALFSWSMITPVPGERSEDERISIFAKALIPRCGDTEREWVVAKILFPRPAEMSSWVKLISYTKKSQESVHISMLSRALRNEISKLETNLLQLPLK